MASWQRPWALCPKAPLRRPLKPPCFHRGHCLIPKEVPVRQESDMKGNELGGKRHLGVRGTLLQTVRNKVPEASLLTGSGRKPERAATAVMKRYKTETHPSRTSLGTRKRSMHPFDPWFYDNARKYNNEHNYPIGVQKLTATAGPFLIIKKFTQSGKL